MTSRAKTLDGKWVEGCLLVIGSNYYITIGTPSPKLKYGGDYHLDAKVTRVNPQTLRYQIADKWYSYNDLQYAVDVWESYVGEER